MKKALIFLNFAVPVVMLAQDAPFYAKENLFDETQPNTLGLEYAPGVETFTVFSPDELSDHFSNGAVLAEFQGKLYCMWQSSASDEDAPDTWVVYSVSEDGGVTWSMPYALDVPDDFSYCTSGGWVTMTDPDLIVAYINVWPLDEDPKGGYTLYSLSSNGVEWIPPMACVKMSDGTVMEGVIEQDIHTLADGRLVTAAHFSPGLNVCPIYTDNPTGLSGWVKGEFTPTPNGDQTRELEPSLYEKPDGSLVMIFRDQESSFCKLASVSTDRGATWSAPVATNMPDARTKQSAGNLPDGTAYFVCCPVQSKERMPLAVVLSDDGECFDRAFLLADCDVPEPRYPGKAKKRGYHYPKSIVAGDWLYTAYTVNKEDVKITRIPLASLKKH